MPRNPPAEIIVLSHHRRRKKRARRPRTAGALLVEMVEDAPPARDLDTITRNMKMLTQAGRLLIAEMQAGLWDEPPGGPAPIRRQP